MGEAHWLSKLHDNPITWMMESTPYTKFRTMTDLLDYPLNHKDVITARNELELSASVRELINSTSMWFPKSVTRHNIPTLSHYGFAALAELGLSVSVPEIEYIAGKAMYHSSNELFCIRQTMPEKGTMPSKADADANEWHAMPCDSPLVSYALIMAGVEDERVIKSAFRIAEHWQSDRGWFCHFFFVEGQYKKLQIGCPMAGLQALQLFSLIPELKVSEAAIHAFAPIKFHWESKKSLYFFGRSKKFWTLKYPFVWYNALYMADVLTRFDFLKGDPLVQELIEWIIDSQDEQGRYTSTSMFMCYKGWDFADKKLCSPWITMLCCRILRRWYGD
ncbi:hypothetical protein KAR48_20930 [bacterium]|nr:hypothetical protein [bacterium]